MPNKHKYHHSPRPARYRSSEPPERWSPKTIAEHLRLVEVLEITRDRLKNGEYAYDWYLAYSCNVGLIARTATNLTRKELKSFVSQYATPGETETMISWAYIADQERQRCEVSGLPMTEVFQAFSDMGIGPRGIETLESFGGNEFCPEFKTKHEFIDYLDRLISSINRNLAQQSELAMQALAQPEKSRGSQTQAIAHIKALSSSNST